MDGWMSMNDTMPTHHKDKFKLSPISIPMPHSDSLGEEEELSNQGKTCKKVTGLGLLILKSLFIQNLPDKEFKLMEVLSHVYVRGLARESI
jgi:hypothetical protein